MQAIVFLHKQLPVLIYGRKNQNYYWFINKEK